MRVKVRYIQETILTPDQALRSLFAYSDVIWVSSGPYALRFDSQQPLGTLAPIWAADHPNDPGWTTWHAQLRSTEVRHCIMDQLGRMSSAALLFARKLRCVDITIGDGRRRLEFSSGIGIVRLLESHGDDSSSLPEGGDYILFRRVIPFYREDADHFGATESELVLAFPVDASVEPQERSHDVHARFPIRDYGLRVRLRMLIYAF